ncbi:hypothetical protein LTR50_002493 [Elasticomyces elasticus]|nr:hypothetical protein LTR50_002493 [Elasticomyces elasticus]
MAGLYDDCRLTHPTSVRFLQIHGDHRFEFDAEVNCTLTVHDLDKSPPYQCLSYVWGPPSDHSIKVNGHVLSVTKNLLGALRRLRAGSKNPDGYLWVDAICIDQSTIPERNAQVSMMGSIYAQADQVIAWLGWEWDRIGDGSDDGRNHELEREDASEVAIEFIRKLGPAMREWMARGGNPWTQQLSQHAFDSPAVYTMLRIEPVRTKTWRALAVFLHRHWFLRAWIVQEAALAKSLVIVCGFEVLTWMDILDTSVFLQASGWFQRLMQLMDPMGIMVPPGWRPILFASLQDISKLQQASPKLGQLIAPPMQDMRAVASALQSRREEESDDIVHTFMEFYIISARYFDAGDARDKVFAPFALLRRSLERYQTELPRPDYDRETEDVYIEYSGRMLQHRTELSLLSHVEDRSARNLQNLPSWCPDFTQTAHSPFSGIPGLSYDVVCSRTKLCTFDAASKTLQLEGSYIDSVTAFGPDFTETHRTKDFRPWIDFCIGLAPVYMNGQDRAEALWRTLIGDFDGLSFPAPTDTASCFKRYLQVCVAQHIHSNVVDPNLVQYTNWAAWSAFDTLSSSSETAAASIPNVRELADFAEFWRKVFVDGYHRLGELKAECGPSDVYGLATGRVYSRRRFFRSRSGMFGLAPLSARDVDQIWLIAGAKVTFILRPVQTGLGGTDFTLVGEAYVHGLMHGELLTRDEQPIWKSIVLR